LVAASAIIGAFVLKGSKKWVLGSGRYLRPSFAKGYGSILDFANHSTSFVVGDDPVEIDARAVASDWSMVGRDLRTVYARIPRKR
jgi:hypothetical protein